PIVPELARMVETEEARIVSHPEYRTPAARLAKLSSGHLLYDLADAAISDWDSFHVRNIGLRIQEIMAARARGHQSRLRDRAVASAIRLLSIDFSTWTRAEQNALSSLSLILSLIPNLNQWTATEKSDLAGLIRAKGSADELDYCHRMHEHARFRREL